MKIMTNSEKEELVAHYKWVAERLKSEKWLNDYCSTKRGDVTEREGNVVSVCFKSES